MSRSYSLVVLAVAVVLFVGAPLALAADKDKNTHEGTFIRAGAAGAHEFTMSGKDGKEHTMTLAKDARVLDAGGKECKLSDLKGGQRIRVTTKEGDRKVATKVEVLKK
jgi:hypothetical protein